MATVATPAVKAFAGKWRAIYKSAVISGIIGDSAHKARGGYHISREDNPSGNYSVTRPDDQYGQRSAASAVDMSMNPADMILCTKRLYVAYKNTKDPRRKYINAFNGWNGSGAPVRYDVYANKSAAASADHKWHEHLSIRRKYVNQPSALDAILSLLKGESVEAYLKSVGVSAPPPLPPTTAPAYPGEVLRRDDNMKPDPNVKKWQEQMRRRGWTSIGEADGVFGEKTEKVVKALQAASKVTVDGEIGPVTWALPWTRPIGS